jgi:hypothetical protein
MRGYRLERIVDLMCDRGGQLTDRGELVIGGLSSPPRQEKLKAIEK